MAKDKRHKDKLTGNRVKGSRYDTKLTGYAMFEKAIVQTYNSRGGIYSK